jgi:hypothetical protein
MGIVGPLGHHPFLHLVRSQGQVWFVFMKPLHHGGVYRRAKETWKGGSSLNKVFIPSEVMDSSPESSMKVRGINV